MNERKSQLIVILHGIGMSTLRMAWLEFGLRRAGYSTLNIGYPSLRRDLAGCAAYVKARLDAYPTGNYSSIHFVTHSMGGLVALELLAEKEAFPVHRAILIAPPYRGSEVADFLHKFRLYRAAFGPSGSQLTTTYRKDIGFVIPTTTEIGIIAGTRGYEYPWFLSIMNKTGEHDGLVSVQSTQIPGAKDSITIRMSHSFLLEKSVKQTLHFLEHGQFKRD